MMYFIVILSYGITANIYIIDASSNSKLNDMINHVNQKFTWTYDFTVNGFDNLKYTFFEWHSLRGNVYEHN